MGGGLADDFTPDHSDMDLSEFLMVSTPSSEDGSVSEFSSCDLSLQQKPARQVADGSKTNTPDALEDDGDTLEDYLTDCSDFKDILMACNDRKVLFGNRAKAPESQKAKQVQELLNYVKEIAKENGNPYMSDLSHEIRENETAFQEKQRQILEMKGGLYTKQEMSQMMKDMAKFYENQQISQMMEMMETKLRETTKRLEQQLNEEQAARLELEKRASEVEKHSSDVVKKLEEEQAARLELEKRASEVDKHSNDVVKKLTKSKLRDFNWRKGKKKPRNIQVMAIKKLKEEKKRAETMTKELQETPRDFNLWLFISLLCVPFLIFIINSYIVS